jgi:hypothetical protein
LPPHCDSLDGPVATAARRALDEADVDIILPFVHADGAAEIRDAFDRSLKARVLGPEAEEVADRWFLETAVIPAAERALESESPDELAEVLCASVRDQVTRRHRRAMELKARAGDSVDSARAYVEAMLGLQVWAHAVHKQLLADPHAHAPGHDHR